MIKLRNKLRLATFQAKQSNATSFDFAALEDKLFEQARAGLNELIFPQLEPGQEEAVRAWLKLHSLRTTTKFDGYEFIVW